MDTIRPVPLSLLRAVTERAKRIGIAEKALLTRRAKLAAIDAWQHGSTHFQSIAAAHAVLGGIPLPTPDPEAA